MGSRRRSRMNESNPVQASELPASKKKRNWRPLLYTLGIIAIITFQGWQNHDLIERLNKQILLNNELQQERSTLQQERSSEAYKNQELSNLLSSYKPHEQLVRATVARDIAADSLNAWRGKQVMLKNDSSIVVLTAVYMGGSRYDTRIYCEVVTRDGALRSVDPELIEPRWRLK